MNSDVYEIAEKVVEARKAGNTYHALRGAEKLAATGDKSEAVEELIDLLTIRVATPEELDSVLHEVWWSRQRY